MFSFLVFLAREELSQLWRWRCSQHKGAERGVCHPGEENSSASAGSSMRDCEQLEIHYSPTVCIMALGQHRVTAHGKLRELPLQH